MTTGQLTIKSGIYLALLAVAVMFLAVFLGIRAGFAGGAGQPDISPESLPNYSSLVINNTLPHLPIISKAGEKLVSTDIVRDKKTVIAVVMPGCGACEALLEEWQTKDLVGEEQDMQIVLFIGMTDNDRDPGELSDFIAHYEHYYCDMNGLNEFWGVRSFPTVIGIGINGKIRFAASVFGGFMDGDYFAENL